ncbi:hypothetical protein ACH5RR_035661 [Cinchona calisaya]|uniref:Uncharacterized protein n=1 Tax=Cinchona calisaya TaxID=153742 RepID=A0ABD2Y5Q4_9GENT
MISAQVELLLVQEDVDLWVQEHAPEIQAMAEWDGIHCKVTDDVWAVYLLQKHCNMSKKALIYYEEDCLGHMAAVAVPLCQKNASGCIGCQNIRKKLS